MSSRAMDGISHAGGVPPPTNPMVTVLLTDMYQLTMAYAYWKAGKHNESAVFDLMFRKNPFGGEYTVFAGLEECIRFAGNFRFTDDEIAYVRTILPPSCEDEFFEFLKGLDCSEVEIYAIPEGSVVFPRVPLIRVEGPLLIAQLLETTFLTLVNYASLVATNAARHRRVAGKSKILLEFGLRRAQGPDGGISASKYCYIGGFDATSNVDAGRRFGIPVRGTHSHAFVSAFMSFDEITERSLPYADGSGVCKDFVQSAQHWLSKLRGAEPLRGIFSETNSSELAAFTSYALAFPSSFQALVDTYDVMRSGIPNFCAVALALQDLGYRALGIRLDSGDLSYLSLEARRLFKLIEDEFKIPGFGKLVITASNDINEETLDALNKQGHEVDAFGIGTHLVTCFQQPALGCVYKLVEINGQPRIKLSEDLKKVTIPCKKQCYRLYGKEGFALVDLLTGADEKPPEVGERILCRHPFSESKRAYVVPQRVEPLYKCFWSTKPGSPCSRSTCVALQDGENSRSSTLFPCRQHASHCRGEAGRILILRAIETALPGAAGCNEARPHAWTEPHSVQGERQWKTVRFHPFSMAKRSTNWGTFVTGFVVVYFIFLPTLLVGSILVAFSYVVLLTHRNLKKLLHCFAKLDMIQVSFQFHKTYR